MDFHQLIVPSLVPKHYYTQIWEQLLNAHVAATFNMLFRGIKSQPLIKNQEISRWNIKDENSVEQCVERFDAESEYVKNSSANKGEKQFWCSCTGLY